MGDDIMIFSVDKLIQRMEELLNILKDRSHPLMKDVRMKNESCKAALAKLILDYLFNEL